MYSVSGETMLAKRLPSIRPPLPSWMVNPKAKAGTLIRASSSHSSQPQHAKAYQERAVKKAIAEAKS